MMLTKLVNKYLLNYKALSLNSVRNQATQKIVRYKRIRNVDSTPLNIPQEEEKIRFIKTPKELSNKVSDESKWKSIKLSTDFTIVGKDDAGLRLDRFIKKKIVDIPQNLLEKLLRKKRITISSSIEDKGKRAKSNDRVSEGQVVHYSKSFEKMKETDKGPDSLSPVLLYSIFNGKDEHIIAINKPAGLSCQGGTGLTDHVDRYLDHIKFGYPEKPKLIHRIDKETTGILLLGRTRLATINMQNLFRSHKYMKKVYWAFVLGRPKFVESGEVKVLMEKALVEGQERIVIRQKANKNTKETKTRFKILKTLSTKGALLALYPLTGRTHQLRVVCSSFLNAPILGDDKYGGITHEKVEGMQTLINNTENLHLHARKVAFTHPETKQYTEIIAPLPKHFKNTLESFGYDIPELTKFD